MKPERSEARLNLRSSNDDVDRKVKTFSKILRIDNLKVLRLNSFNSD